MIITAYDLALRFVGLQEVPGVAANPAILAMLRLDPAGAAVGGDDTPWCSAFVNYIAWLLRLPRSKSLAARSWLNIGTPLALAKASAGFDVVIFSRGLPPQPPASVLDAPGHVAWYAGRGPSGEVLALGGNQGDTVSIASFAEARVLGVRRLSN